jgi:DNA processing protein
VVERGVVYSEVPPGIAARPWRFPVRNRVLAALADAVVVVESPGAGGSMHTVREAMGRDRPVLAVPGPIDSRASEGTNRLISEGAHPCLGPDDVLLAIGLVRGDRPRRSDEPSPTDPRPVPTGAAATVLDAIGWRPVTVEHLALRTGIEFGALALALGALETDGWIVRTGGWIERRAKPEGVRRREVRPA